MYLTLTSMPTVKYVQPFAEKYHFVSELLSKLHLGVVQGVPPAFDVSIQVNI